MSTPLPPNVHVSSHPCLQAKLSQLRSSTTTSAKEVTSLIHDITTILSVEALASSLTTQQSSETATTPLSYPYTPTLISPTQISLIPILRSGLSMLPAVQTLLPIPTAVHHLGLYREKSTLQPVEYYNNLPYHRTNSSQSEPSSLPDLAIILDPIIATGATLSAAVETLRDWGVSRVVALSVLASRGGLERVVEEASGVQLEVWTGAVDDGTDQRGMIVPGLGDVGDRLYMTIGK